MRSSSSRSIAFIALVLLGCSEASPKTPECLDGPVAESAWVLEHDLGHQGTALGLLNRDGCLETHADIALGQDPVIASSRGRTFVIARDTGLVLEVSPDQANAVQSLSIQARAGTWGNVQDVAVDAAGQIWAALYNGMELAVFAQGAETPQWVPLPDVGDPDGSLEVSAIHSTSEAMLVVVQRLDRDQNFASVRTGLLIALEPEVPHAVLWQLDLGLRNPFGRIALGPEGRVMIACPAGHDTVDDDGGIAMVDLHARTVQTIPEAVLGGTAGEVTWPSSNQAYVIVEGPVAQVNPTWVLELAPDERRVVRTIADSRANQPGFVHAGLLAVGDELLVGDRTPGAPRHWLYPREPGANEAPRSLTPFVYPALAFAPAQGDP